MKSKQQKPAAAQKPAAGQAPPPRRKEDALQQAVTRDPRKAAELLRQLLGDK